MITRARENDLVIRAKAGDRAALAELLDAHSGWFHKQSLKFARGDEDLADDLLQEANIAAIDCLKTFNPSLGFRFLTYVTYKLRQRLGRMCRPALIKLPVAFSYSQISESARADADRAANADRWTS